MQISGETWSCAPLLKIAINSVGPPLKYYEEQALDTAGA